MEEIIEGIRKLDSNFKVNFKVNFGAPSSDSHRKLTFWASKSWLSAKSVDRESELHKVKRNRVQETHSLEGETVSVQIDHEVENAWSCEVQDELQDELPNTLLELESQLQSQLQSWLSKFQTKLKSNFRIPFNKKGTRLYFRAWSSAGGC